jgi:hypothetical protein
MYLKTLEQSTMLYAAENDQNSVALNGENALGIDPVIRPDGVFESRER